MDYVTVRELREQSGKVWQRIEAGEEIIVTRNGKPFALLLHTEPSEVETALRAHRAARMGAVLERLQAQARQSGAAKMTQKAVQDEISAARSQRRAAGKRAQAKDAASRRR
jgi:antitoxin (DNA-binding transcriptional repressor) of toxin-antitoxin stability system